MEIRVRAPNSLLTDSGERCAGEDSGQIFRIFQVGDACQAGRRINECENGPLIKAFDIGAKLPCGLEHRHHLANSWRLRRRSFLTDNSVPSAAACCRAFSAAL